MQLDGYVQQVRDQLTAAAALGNDDVRQLAATLADAASPAVRLAVLAALAAAADEITAALLDSPGAPTVAVHLDTDEVRIAVSGGVTEPVQGPRPEDGDASARISLRLSEPLKSEIDAAAARAEVSVNTWLVRAATTALSAAPHAAQGAGSWGHGSTNAHHVTGWING
jgi:HicB family